MMVAARLPYLASETELRTYTGLPELDPRAWDAIKAWCEFHDIDPNRVPMHNHFVRDVEGRRVEYDELVFGEDGRLAADLERGECVVRRVCSQGEGPPLPFPPELFVHRMTGWRP
jgi:hypothetical protein